MKKITIIISLLLAFQFAEAQYSSLGKGWSFKSTRQYDHKKNNKGYGVNYIFWNIGGDDLLEIYFANGDVSRYRLDNRLRGPKKGYTGDGDSYTIVKLSNVNGSGWIGVQMINSSPSYIRLHYTDSIVDFYEE
jgi:hypothetical protein